jgi:hypothetical protein
MSLPLFFVYQAMALKPPISADFAMRRSAVPD